ncbi:helix-turn-helix domain-containing protein [Hydrogenophaga sp. XSHU_21]
MTTPPLHRARVLPGPLAGVHGLHLHSARGFGRHWHDSFGFGVMDEGAHRTASGRGPVLAQAGQIVTVNPGEVHDGVPLGGQPRRWRMVHLAPDTVAALVGDGDHEFTRPVIDDPLLQRAVARLFGQWPAVSEGGPAEESGSWEEALTEVCGLLLVRHGLRRVTEGEDARLAWVRECLLDRLDQPPTLDELARLAGLTRFQLVRRFARAHGLPPFAWLQQHRLSRARALMDQGLPLSEVALACGYTDQSHLNRHFMRSFGFTPGAWKRAGQRSPQ